MAFKVTEWPYLLATDPDKAKEKIKEAYGLALADRKKAAEGCGLSVRRWEEIVARLKMREDLDKIRDHYKAIMRPEAAHG